MRRHRRRTTAGIRKGYKLKRACKKGKPKHTVCRKSGGKWRRYRVKR